MVPIERAGRTPAATALFGWRLAGLGMSFHTQKRGRCHALPPQPKESDRAWTANKFRCTIRPLNKCRMPQIKIGL